MRTSGSDMSRMWHRSRCARPVRAGMSAPTFRAARARLHALYRRLPRVCAEMQRGAGGRLRRFHSGCTRFGAAQGALHGTLAHGAGPGRSLPRGHRCGPDSPAVVDSCRSTPASRSAARTVPKSLHPSVRQLGDTGGVTGKPSVRVDVVERGGEDESAHRRGATSAPVATDADCHPRHGPRSILPNVTCAADCFLNCMDARVLDGARHGVPSAYTPIVHAAPRKRPRFATSGGDPGRAGPIRPGARAWAWGTNSGSPMRRNSTAPFEAGVRAQGSTRATPL